jgi:prepilin-type N-terminal cleavage/methylation domain-containing protein
METEMTSKRQRSGLVLGGVRLSHGFSLLELLMVIAMVGTLVCLATLGGKHLVRDWQLKRAGHQLLEDLKAVQGKAERSGSVSMSNGSLVTQRVFLVFEPETLSYSVYLWQDHDGNGVTEAEESRQLWKKSLPPQVSFGWRPGIDRRACSNVNSSPGDAISFARPAYAPCNNQPCIKFDQQGFSLLGPGAIYLKNGEQTLAITGTRPGHFTMCEWNGEAWQ